VTLDQRIVLAPGDGSLGPLLRIADDRLEPATGYGRHEHSAVDVVAVVLAGTLHHRWDGDVPMAAGDAAVLRSGAGLEHDEVAGDGGARVLQCYLRSAAPSEPAAHEVHHAASGWLDLHRDDARLWIGRTPAAVPAGLLVLRGADSVLVEEQPGRTVRDPGLALVWRLDTGRPSWAD
jgi:hypothetical protein